MRTYEAQVVIANKKNKNLVIQKNCIPQKFVCILYINQLLYSVILEQVLYSIKPTIENIGKFDE